MAHCRPRARSQTPAVSLHPRLLPEKRKIWSREFYLNRATLSTLGWARQQLTGRRKIEKAYQQPFELVVAALRSDARQGLSHDEARVGLEQHGRNELAADPPVAAWRKF